MPKKFLVFTVSLFSFFALLLTPYSLRLLTVSAQTVDLPCIYEPTTGVCSLSSGGQTCSNPPNCSTWANDSVNCQASHPCTVGPTPTPAGGAASTYTLPSNVWYNPTLDSFYHRVFDPPESEIFGERYTYAQVVWIIHSISLQNFNPREEDQLNDLKATITKAIQGKDTIADYGKYGPMGLMIMGMGQMYANPPASGIQEIAGTLNKFNLAAPVYAQGYGYNNTNAIQPVWIAVRNSAYLFLIILLVAAGFMIMFRIKINPQTVVSIQLMIPRLVMALLGITFSYAIAGLVIDLTYVVVIFILSTFSGSSIAGGSIIANLNTAISFFATPGLWKIFGYYLLYWLSYILTSTASLDIFSALLALILGIVVLFLLLKIFWMMLKTYVTFLILIIIAPWQIMLGVIPSSGSDRRGNAEWVGGFGAWFRNLIAQASVFVVVPILFFFAIVLSSPDWQHDTTILPGLNAVATWALNYLVAGVNPTTSGGGSYPAFPLFGFGSNGGIDFRFYISIVILAMMPKTAEIIRDALKIPPFKYGNAIGEAFQNPVTGFIGGTLVGKGTAISRGNSSWTAQAAGGLLQSVGSKIQKPG